MKINVLNGDCLAESFSEAQIEGEILVCRECLIEGDLDGENLDEFFRSREKYLSENYPKSENFYRQKVVHEFEKIISPKSDAEINLWFGNDLFCQVNLWFILSLIPAENENVFRVFPKNLDFADETASDLRFGLAERKKISTDERTLATDLWKAFRQRNRENLKNLTEKKTACFPNLPELGLAAAEIENRPKEILKKIIAETGDDFGKVFSRFSKSAPIYGFGDSQVRKIYENLVSNGQVRLHS